MGMRCPAKFKKCRRLGILICAGLICVLTVTGCMFRELKRNIARLQEMALIGGKVSWEDTASPLVVVLLGGSSDKVVDSYSLTRPGSYFFVVPQGAYRLAAFVDLNHDLTYQPGREPAAFYGDSSPMRVSAGGETKGINIHVAKNAMVPAGIPAVAMTPGKRGSGLLPDMHIGEIVKIDDPRFTVENGAMGLWQPVDFLFKVGAGIYFLEPYDHHKMPILFIHGAGGNPSNWKYLVEHLDRTKFQPWLVYYPSGVSIDETACSMARWIEVLSARYGARRFVIVAHSMGGLVARAAINRATAEGGCKHLVAFVTISTPWGGHAAAEVGVKHAPVVMPLWYDITPGSPVLSEIFQKPLPAQCSYTLLFSYSGSSRFLDEPNDGTVAISSELSATAQHAANKIYGFKEDHTSILGSQDVSRLLNAILAEAISRDGKAWR